MIRQVEVRREGRVEVREDIRRDLLAVVELEREVAAAPGSSCTMPAL